MRRLRLTSVARRDLIRIASYISRESRDRSLGHRFVDRVEAHCEKLASLPATLGTARPELEPGLRSTPFGNYLIFFRYVDDTVEIVKIIEGHRDIVAQFDEPDS